jgi:hypothetical protein
MTLLRCIAGSLLPSPESEVVAGHPPGRTATARAQRRGPARGSLVRPSAHRPPEPACFARLRLPGGRHAERAVEQLAGDLERTTLDRRASSLLQRGRRARSPLARAVRRRLPCTIGAATSSDDARCVSDHAEPGLPSRFPYEGSTRFGPRFSIADSRPASGCRRRTSSPSATAREDRPCGEPSRQNACVGLGHSQAPVEGAKAVIATGWRWYVMRDMTLLGANS